MAKNKNNVEPEKKKKGGFGKFCKGLFVIISLAAMGGCGFFGYMYFKDRIPTGKISFAQAKELVYTVAHDLGYINSTTFQHDLEKEPLAKPTNIVQAKVEGDEHGKFDMYDEHASQVKPDFDTFENYASDDVYTTIAYNDYVNYIEYSYMQDMLQLFAFDELQENKSYKVDSYADLGWSFQLENDGIVFTAWSTSGNSYDDSNWNSQEYIYKFTILESSEAGIESYKISYKYLNNNEVNLRLFAYSLTVGKAKVGGNRCFTSVSSAVIHVTYPGLIMGEDDLKTVGTSNMLLVGFDLDINQDYILAAKQEAEQITDRITVNKVIDAFVDDEHIHVDALKYYKDTSVTNLF